MVRSTYKKNFRPVAQKTSELQGPSAETAERCSSVNFRDRVKIRPPQGFLLKGSTILYLWSIAIGGRLHTENRAKRFLHRDLLRARQRANRSTYRDEILHGPRYGRGLQLCFYEISCERSSSYLKSLRHPGTRVPAPARHFNSGQANLT